MSTGRRCTSTASPRASWRTHILSGTVPTKADVAGVVTFCLRALGTPTP